MAPRGRPTRLNPDATPTPVTDTHTTTSVTNAQIQAMINEGVTAALAARDATRNGDDSHTSGTGLVNYLTVMDKVLIQAEPVAILDRRLKKVGNVVAVFVLVHWSNSSEEDAT
ncbi:hypothetical protein Tco_0587601 [Tanacetum coccineum]